MTDLEKVKSWIETYPEFDTFASFNVDCTTPEPANGGLSPAGLVEISRKKDIMGNCIVINQYNFTLFFVFAKAPEDGIGASENAQWIMDFQRWVQEQSITKAAPVFGNMPRHEKITASNGTLIDASEEGYAVYSVQLAVQFGKYYETGR